MLTTEERDVARAAAAVLQSEMPAGFTGAVESALASGGRQQAPPTYEPGTAIALGSLLVSAASLAWTIYKDLRKETAQPSKSVLARKVRLRLSDEQMIDANRAERIIEVVVEEVVKADPR